MLQKLKRHAILQLALTIFLTLSLLMTTYYLFYSRIIYKDYEAKANSLSEIYSQNIGNYMKQLDKNTSTFINYFDINVFDDFEHPEFRLHVTDALSSITKYQVNMSIAGIIVVLNDRSYITDNPYGINFESIKQSGILDYLKDNPVCVYYNPDIKIFFENTNEAHFLFGKTIYDLEKKQSFYVIEAINANKFLEKIKETGYFINNSSVYIKTVNTYLTVTENNKTKLTPEVLSAGKDDTRKRNIKTSSIHNEDYNIDVVTRFTTNDTTIFISFLKNSFVLLCLIVGVLGLIFSKKIIEHIVYPLEKTYVEINKNVFK